MKRKEKSKKGKRKEINFELSNCPGTLYIENEGNSEYVYCVKIFRQHMTKLSWISIHANSDKEGAIYTETFAHL